MTILFKNGKKLEVDICGTDIHQNLIIELETEDYNSVKDILLDENATVEIQADGNTYYDYTRVKYLNSSIADSGKTKIKAALVYGKDVTNALADVVSKVDILQTDTASLNEQVSDLGSRSNALEETQLEQDEAIEYLMTDGTEV